MTSRRRRPPSRSRLRAAAAGLLLVGAAACGDAPRGDGPAGAPPEPLLVVGADGLEWDVVLPLVRAGRMPVLAGLMERGSYGLLETMVPTQSPRIWNTMATGELPEEHGILGFVVDLDAAAGRPRPARGRDRELRLYTSRDRRAKAFWNVLGEHGVRSDTIGWWTTYPAEEVAGLMVAQCNTVDRAGGMNKGSVLRDTPGAVHPPEREAEVLAVLDAVEAELDALVESVFGALPPDLDEDEAWHVESCRWSLRADETYGRVAAARLASPERSAVTAVYFGATDVLAHHFWHAHDAATHGLDADDRTVRLFGSVVARAYERFDAQLGALLEAAGEPLNVVVVADHGHGPRPEVLDQGPGWFRERHGEHPRTKFGDHRDAPPGVFVAAGPAFARGGPAPADARRDELPRLAHVADVGPLVLALAGVPVAADTTGSVPGELLDPAWLAAHPLRTVPTHDDPAWRAARAAAAGDVVPGSDERLGQLRDLGYLDED